MPRYRFQEVRYKELTAADFEMLMADLALKGGDQSVDAILRLLYEQEHVRKEYLMTARLALTSVLLVALLFLLCIFVPSARIRVFAGLGGFAVLAVTSSTMYFWLKARGEYRDIDDQLFRIRNSALTALSQIVRAGKLSPVAVDKIERSTLLHAMAKTARTDEELQVLLRLLTPSERDLKYRRLPDL